MLFNQRGPDTGASYTGHTLIQPIQPYKHQHACVRNRDGAQVGTSGQLPDRASLEDVQRHCVAEQTDDDDDGREVSVEVQAVVDSERIIVFALCRVKIGKVDIIASVGSVASVREINVDFKSCPLQWFWKSVTKKSLLYITINVNQIFIKFEHKILGGIFINAHECRSFQCPRVNWNGQLESYITDVRF